MGFGLTGSLPSYILYYLLCIFLLWLIKLLLLFECLLVHDGCLMLPVCFLHNAIGYMREWVRVSCVEGVVSVQCRVHARHTLTDVTSYQHWQYTYSYLACLLCLMPGHKLTAVWQPACCVLGVVVEVNRWRTWGHCITLTHLCLARPCCHPPRIKIFAAISWYYWFSLYYQLGKRTIFFWFFGYSNRKMF